MEEVHKVNLSRYKGAIMEVTQLFKRIARSHIECTAKEREITIRRNIIIVSGYRQIHLERVLER